MDISNSVVENSLSEYHMSYSNYDWGWSEYDNKSNTNGICKDWEEWRQEINNNRDYIKKGVSIIIVINLN